ncbi:secretin N-terminal domain-containing protein [Candidatus Albibeggiatoa sp. nov. BB20]|uniref:secretin N-terminal domain-containing protein n=1 Tax=Candidatus Albibeggiatoa sp. nov. BB20 TaxID=3162723 RepID=UPI003365AEDA
MSFKSLTSLILLTGLLASCATPPKKVAPRSALDVASTHLQQEMPSVTNTISSDSPITALPKTKVEPLREINQIGSLPTIKTSTEKPPKFSLKAGQPLKFNFEQVPLRDVVQIIADTMGISIVVDTTIGAEKITMRTADGKDLRKQDLWPLLQLLLSESGITMEKRGGVYYLKKIGAGSGLPGTIGLKLSGKGDSSQVLQITPLRYITAESASAAITPMIQPQGRILNLANLNIIGIITTPTVLDRVNRLIKIIDADPFVHRGIRLFRLQNSKASEIKAELDQILQAVMGSAPAYQVIALERINAILIVAPPKGGFREVEMWLNVLDEQSDESIEQIFIYRVKNLEAKELAATLSDVFEQDDKKDEEVKKKDELDSTLPNGQLPLQVSDNKAALEKERGETKDRSSIAVSAELTVNIVADEKTNSLLIRATPRDYQQLLETIRMLDRVPKEVMVNVVIAQVTLTETTKFGIDWTALINRFGVDSNGGATQSNVRTNFGVDSTSDAGGLILNYFSGDITALLNLVDSDGSVSLLSRPSILVRNNEEASINVGTNEPVITRTNTSTSSSITTGYTSNEVQYRDTGIILKVTPRINDDGIINMKVSQEVSQIDTSRANQQYPAFSQRKIETNVVIRDATAIVIGGLIQDDGKYGNSGLPFLRKTKLRPLFSSTSDENTRTELVLIIVPQIVNPELNNDPILKQFQSQMNLVDSLFLENDMNFNHFTQQYSQENYNNLYR